ncbi:MAG: integration host factor subunit beta [Caulobacteraceae bacterium]
MLKSNLVDRLAGEHPELTRREAERVVAVVMDEVITALEQGGRVELRGFGTFEIRTRQARVGRNPQTGETVQVELKATPFFTSGKALRQRLNGA